MSHRLETVISVAPRYYLRTKAAADAIKFTVEVQKKAQSSDSEETTAPKELEAIKALKAEKPRYECASWPQRLEGKESRGGLQLLRRAWCLLGCVGVFEIE